MKLIKTRKLAILDFDIENRPLTYLGMDYTTAEITAIACSWVGEDEVKCWLLTQDLESGEEMLRNFVEHYNEADIVTGHYIRKHDLPIINGALLEYGMEPLSEKLTSDTKMDLTRRSGISASQESLAGMYGLPEPKHHMSQTEWRAANRLHPNSFALTQKRVVDDVIQHKALRQRLVEANALNPPQVWRP